MTDELGRLLVAIFDNANLAEEALETLRQADAPLASAVQAAATVIRDRDGVLAIKETADPGGSRGALAGGLVGAVIGLLGGPGGAIVAGAAGALVGGLTAKIIDSGIPDHSLELIGQSLLPGDSAVVIIVDDALREQTSHFMASLGARVLTGSLISVIAEQLQLPPTAAEDEPRQDD